MPYVITTTTGCGYCTHCGYGGESSATCLHKTESRIAVATLQEARATVKRAVNAKGDTRQRFEAHHLPESGKTIGPLPDGTVIEVRLITLTELSLAAGLPMTRELHAALRDEDATPIIAAFNGDRSTA